MSTGLEAEEKMTLELYCVRMRTAILNAQELLQFEYREAHFKCINDLSSHEHERMKKIHRAMHLLDDSLAIPFEFSRKTK